MSIEKIKEYLNKYKNYNDGLDLINEKYELLYEKCLIEGRMPSEFEVRKIELESEKIMEKLSHEKTAEEKEMKEQLTSFSQEELVFMYNISSNESIKRLVEDVIWKNDAEIKSINSFSESGVIFEMLSKKSNEDINKIFSLRESDNLLCFKEDELNDFSSDAKIIITQTLNGNLSDAKKKFMEEHNLSSELEFDFYKNNLLNKRIIEAAEDIQKSLNEMFGIEDDSFIKDAQEKLMTTKPKKK